jgi:ATP-dependent RNA helicase RhlB
MKFNELSLNKNLQAAIDDIGFSEMTPIQELAIPEGLKGKDITGLAQTGTGKTISFLVPIINKIYEENLSGTIALILAPTRELVLQICDEAKRLVKYSDIKVATIIGGTGYKEQEKELSQKSAIIVATPGRLIDHIKSGNLDLKSIKFFVLDEADRMFDMGFIKDIRYVMKYCPADKQVLLFSATLSYYVIRLANDYLRDPVEIKIEHDRVVTDNIEQSIIHLGRDEKIPFLVNKILKDNDEGLGIIFTNLKVMVPEIVNTLRNYGIAITGISSMLDQKKRIRLLKDFKLGKYKYMVATDVASRGIDVENIKVVYNYDLPGDIENYVHRIGRTARAGKKGKSISFCSERDYEELEKIEKFIGNKLNVTEVDESDLKLPLGEFQRFIPHGESDSAEFLDRKKNSKENFNNKNNRNNKKEKVHSKGKFKKDFKDKNERPKKINLNPVDEALSLLQKADSVLEIEKGSVKKSFKPKFEKKSKSEDISKEIYKPKEKSAESNNYDKSKRNLFDINDVKKDDNKRKSIWGKLKSLLGL